MSKKTKKRVKKYKSIFIEKNLPELIEVEWQDHWSQAGWLHKSQVDTDPNSCVNRTVGYKIEETKDVLYLAATITSGEQIGRSGGILKRDIVSRRKIK